MKKTILILGLGIISLGLFSCEKEVIQPSTPQGSQITKLKLYCYKGGEVDFGNILFTNITFYNQITGEPTTEHPIVQQESENVFFVEVDSVDFNNTVSIHSGYGIQQSNYTNFIDKDWFLYKNDSLIDHQYTGQYVFQL